MRRLRHAVIPLVLLVVLGIGLVTSHEAVAQEERDNQYWIDRYVDDLGWSRQHAATLVFVNARTRWIVETAMEALRTGDVEDYDNTSIFRGPSLADLEAQLSALDSRLARLSNLPMAQCMP